MVWLFATRRYAAAAWSLVVALVITLTTWAVVGFAGFRDYPRVGRIFADHYGPGTYTPLSFLMKVGVASPWARAGGFTLGVAALAAVFAMGRRSQAESASFALAVGAALLWAPIAWLHYFSLIIIPLAILSPTLSPAWLLPVLLWTCPVGAPSSAWQFALPLLISAAVLLLPSPDRLRSLQQQRRATLQRGALGNAPVMRGTATEVEPAR